MTESSSSPRRRRRRAGRTRPVDRVEATAGAPAAEVAGGDPASGGGASVSGTAVGDAAVAASGGRAPGGTPAQPGQPTPGDHSPPAPRPRRHDNSGTSTGKGRRRAGGRQADTQSGKDTDRGWRELLGNAPSQVGVSGALRARDVARPTAAELAAAERELVIVRRQWKPPEDMGR